MRDRKNYGNNTPAFCALVTVSRQLTTNEWLERFVVVLYDRTRNPGESHQSKATGVHSQKYCQSHSLVAIIQQITVLPTRLVTVGPERPWIK